MSNPPKSPFRKGGSEEMSLEKGEHNRNFPSFIKMVRGDY